MTRHPVPLLPSASFPELALAEGFADRVERWAREAGAPHDTLRALWRAALGVSLATASGHVCTHLDEISRAERAPTADNDEGLESGTAIGRDEASNPDAPFAGEPPDPGTLREKLLRSRMVGTPMSPGALPLILDDDGRLYLHRYFDYEKRLARRLADAAQAPGPPLSPDVRALLDALFAANAARLSGRPDQQKIATALALERRLAVVSGGPGTGKTTTVARLLACALARDPDCRIALAAPTGKAAARMVEAIRAAAQALPESLRARMPSESFTVHRLLGVRGDTGEFRHHAGNPLPIDLLVVDEASMLDLALATRLAEAVPAAAHIVLLGDKDQLAAVEAGAVFAELAAGPAQCAVWLTENFRFAKDSGIGRLAALVNAGDTAGAIELLRAPVDASLEWIDDAGRLPGADTAHRIIAGFAHYVDALGTGFDDRHALFDALAHFRVLCAEREGPRGVAEINALLSRHVRTALDHPLDPGPRSKWYPGQPVMVLRNDYVLKLFNGDVGIVLPDAEAKLCAWFRAGDGAFRAIPTPRLPEHETAFASTVHKAQGSEFDQVLLLLPAGPSRVVTRELIYTAITRAGDAVTIVGGREGIEAGIAAPTRRYSGLAARLAETGD